MLTKLPFVGDGTYGIKYPLSGAGIVPGTEGCKLATCPHFPAAPPSRSSSIPTSDGYPGFSKTAKTEACAVMLTKLPFVGNGTYGIKYPLSGAGIVPGTEGCKLATCPHFPAAPPGRSSSIPTSDGYPGFSKTAKTEAFAVMLTKLPFMGAAPSGKVSAGTDMVLWMWERLKNPLPPRAARK